MSDDKPGHILEIPESLGRDVDAFYAGKRPAPPMEAFMSDAALEQVAAQTAAASTPVHAEDLVPITKAEATRRTTFDGETLPNMPATRRVIPVPFKRPRFDLDRHGRDWTNCAAEKVAKGDMVAVDGQAFRVESVDQVNRYETIAGIPDVATGVKVIITGIAGNQAEFDLGQDVRAFRKVELWAASGEAASASSTSGAERESPPTATPATSMSPASTTTRR